MVNPSSKDHIPLRMLTCLADSLSFLHALSTPPTSQQKLRSAKALWKVLRIPKVNFSRQNPPKKSDSLTSALHPGKTRKWTENGVSVTHLWPSALCTARERDALLCWEHPRREETDAFPSSPTAFPIKYVSPVKTHLFCRHLWNIHNAPTIQPSARERWLKQPLPLRSQKARPNYKTRIKRPSWPSHKT